MQTLLDHAFLEHLRLPAPVFTALELATLNNFVVASGVKPEGGGGRVFDISQRPWLAPLYDESRDKPHQRVVIQKAAQMGLTIHLLYRAMWLCADPDRTTNTALLFPTQSEVYDLMRSRFRPMLLSGSRLQELIRDVDSMEVVRIGASNMRFRGTRTGIAVDSFPADALLVDEVRLHDVATLERLFLRVSESSIVGQEGERGLIQLVSTAGFPGSDINYYFERSTQNEWHTVCPNMRCTNHGGFVMADTWPDCVDAVRMRYICPKCGTEITDPQRGQYIPRGAATAPWQGYAFNQLLKGPEHLPEVYRAFERMVISGANPSEFYNSYLGRPHKDPNAVLVTEDVFAAAVGLDPAYHWPLPGPDAAFTSVGIDQRGVEKHIVITRAGSGGRVYLAHLEVVEKSGPAAIDYIKWLISQWHADIVVCDAMPAYDFSAGLGRALPRALVWLAEYVSGDHPVMWSDQRDKKDLKRATGEAKYEYIVHLDRYKHLLQAFTLWQNRRVVMPTDAYAKTQLLTREGKPEPVSLAGELSRHLQNIARVALPVTRRDPKTGETVDTGRYTYTFRHLAVDPHFAHAWGYSVAGLMRRVGTTQITGKPAADPVVPPRGTEQMQLPEVMRPANLSHAARKSCSSCKFFKPGDTRVAGHLGSLGYCQNARVAAMLGASPPVRTGAGPTSCTMHRGR